MGTITIALAFIVVVACLTCGVWHWNLQNKRALSAFEAWVRTQGGYIKSVDVKYSPSTQRNVYTGRWIDAGGHEQTTEFDVALLGPVTFTRKT